MSSACEDRFAASAFQRAHRIRRCVAARLCRRECSFIRPDRGGSCHHGDWNGAWPYTTLRDKAFRRGDAAAGGRVQPGHRVATVALPGGGSDDALARRPRRGRFGAAAAVVLRRSRIRCHRCRGRRPHGPRLRRAGRRPTLRSRGDRRRAVMTITDAKNWDVGRAQGMRGWSLDAPIGSVRFYSYRIRGRWLLSAVDRWCAATGRCTDCVRTAARWLPAANSRGSSWRPRMASRLVLFAYAAEGASSVG